MLLSWFTFWVCNFFLLVTNPLFPILPVLFFPNRYDFLNTFDGIPACFKSCSSVWGGNSNNNSYITYVQSPNSMGNCSNCIRPFFLYLFADFFHFLFRHR